MPVAYLTPSAPSPSVLSKTRQILDAFMSEELGAAGVLPLSELARRSGVPKASVHRLCQELVEWGLLERAGRGSGYRLGLLLFEMGQRVSRQRLVRDAAVRPMEALVAFAGATAHLGIADGHDVLYVEKLPGPRPVEAPSTVAGRLPLHVTATGKVLLAFGPPDLLHEVLAAGPRRNTPRTLVAPALLRAQLERVRAEGLAIEVEETRLGYASMAAPVSDGTEVVAALSLTAPTNLDLRRFEPALRSAAAAVSRALAARD
ncbi:MAG TPA: IclR family transcriptional regulator [Pseudonocardia sp.]|nr:IclR family transcriptional regulator [Pseudonocardia sp.]